MGHVSKASGWLRIFPVEFMSIEEHLQSSRERLQLTSIKRGRILLMEGAFLNMEELVGEVEASQRKWYTS